MNINWIDPLKITLKLSTNFIKFTCFLTIPDNCFKLKLLMSLVTNIISDLILKICISTKEMEMKIRRKNEKKKIEKLMNVQKIQVMNTTVSPKSSTSTVIRNVCTFSVELIELVIPIINKSPVKTKNMIITPINMFRMILISKKILEIFLESLELLIIGICEHIISVIIFWMFAL
ncbi:hypothetical protein ACKWTF_005670 [Chironomus riparius]